MGIETNDPATIKNRTAQLRSLYWKYLFRLPTQDEFNGMALADGLLTDEDSWKRVKDGIPSSQAAELAMREVGGGKPNTRTVPSGYDFGSSTDYDPAATGTGTGTGGGGTVGGGTGYNLEKLKSAWLGAAGRYAPTRAGLAQFIADNSGTGGFAEGVTIGGSKKNKLYLGSESSGTFLGDVIRGTDSDNPTYDWDTSTGGGSTQTTASTSETAAQRAARMAALGFGPDSFQPRAAGPMPDQPKLGDMMGPQGPIRDPGTYTPGAAYLAPEYLGPDPYQVATPFDRPEYQAATPFAAPTEADMKQDPGYQFRLSEGQRALENANAAKGISRGGATLRGLMDYGAQAASQEYGNVFNRNLDTYKTNENNRAAAYNANYSNALKAYDINEGNRADAYNTNTKNAYQKYTTNELKNTTFNNEAESRRADAFSTNSNLFQKQQSIAREMAQQVFDNAMKQYQDEITNTRQRERDRMNDLQFAAGA